MLEPRDFLMLGVGGLAVWIWANREFNRRLGWWGYFL